MSDSPLKLYIKRIVIVHARANQRVDLADSAGYTTFGQQATVQIGASDGGTGANSQLRDLQTLESLDQLRRDKRCIASCPPVL